MPRFAGVPVEQETAVKKPRFRGIPVEEESSASSGDLARSALQGLTMGASDELGTAAAASAAYIDEALGRIPNTGRGWKDIYDEMMQVEHEKMGKFREAHPGAAVASELAGGLATGGAGAAKLMGARALQSIRPLTRAGVVGATEGGVYGSLSGKPGERGEAAAVGAVTGGVGGPALQAAGRVAGNLARPLGNRLRNAVLGDPVTDARNYLATGLGREGVQSVGSLVPQTRGADMATLADVSQSARGMLEGLVSDADSPQIRRLAQEALGTRNRQNQARLFDMIDEDLGTSGQTFAETVSRLKQVRSDTAAPLYDAARAKSVRPTDYMKAMLNPRTGPPEILSALSQSRRHMATKRAAGERVSTIDIIDSMKQNMDDTIRNLYRNGKNNRARFLTQVKNRIVADVDEQIPEYRAARNAFAGESQLIDAAQLGTEILRKDVDYMDDILRTMSDSERGMFRIGAKKAIREKLMQAREGTNAVNRVASEINLDRMRRAFPTQGAFERFRRDIRFEANIFETERVLHNSMTALRQSEQRALERGVDFRLPDNIGNDMYSMAANGIKRILERSLSPEARLHLGQLILTPIHQLPGDAAQRINMRILDSLPESQQGAFMRMVTAARSAGAAGTITAPAITPSVFEE